MSEAISLRVKAVAKRFGRRRLLDGISLQLRRACCTLLTGENGTGKSTLLRILAGLEKPDGGRFCLAGGCSGWRRARRQLQRRVTYLHQQPYLFDGSVAWNLEIAMPGREDRERQVRRALEWIGMESFREAPARALSGGERQRVALARAWLASPEIMLLDEPTANLDAESRSRTLQLLKELRSQGMTLVIASHDPHHFEGLWDRHLGLYQGRLEQLAPRPEAPPARVIPIHQDYA